MNQIQLLFVYLSVEIKQEAELIFFRCFFSFDVCPNEKVKGFEHLHAGDVVRQVEDVVATVQQHAVHLVDDDIAQRSVSSYVAVYLLLFYCNFLPR